MVLLKGFAFWPQVIGVVQPPTTKQRRQITAPATNPPR
jgi:hypothetical protein